MRIEQEELLELLQQLVEATGNMEEQVRILSHELNVAHSEGVAHGLNIARIHDSIMSPNSFDQMIKMNGSLDNSDDLYVNA